MSSPTDREVDDLLDELRHEVDANPYATLAQRALLAIYNLHRDRQSSAARIAALEAEVADRDKTIAALTEQRDALDRLVAGLRREVDELRPLAAGAPRWKEGDKVLIDIRGRATLCTVIDTTQHVGVRGPDGYRRERIESDLSPAPPAEGKGEP